MDLGDAGELLRAARRRRLEAGALGLAAGLAAVPVSLLVSLPLGLALALGAVFEALVAAAASLRRRDLLERLAADPAAYALPEIQRFGRGLADRRRLSRLGDWIAEILDESRAPFSLYLGERVEAHADELRMLSLALRSPHAHVRPVTAAACLRLLTRAAESPLYNPRIPAEELGLRLREILRGIA